MKKILSIDGGGIRGIIPAIVLSEIEKKSGRNIASMFDLIAGTSTGSLLALGLCKPDAEGNPEYLAKKLAALYERHGRAIFSRSFWRSVSTMGGLIDEKYPHDAMERVFDYYYGEATLGGALTNVLISSYDIENRQPFFFKSWRDEMKSVAMREIARAACAAPTYFEPARVQVGNELLALIDGNIFVNNPALSAYAEARRLYPEETAFLVVSLGTGKLTRPIKYEEAKDWGLAAWAIPILGVVFDGVSKVVDYQLRQLLEEKFFRFQTELDIASDDMDNASRANIEALKLQTRQLLRIEKNTLENLCALLKES